MEDDLASSGSASSCNEDVVEVWERIATCSGMLDAGDIYRSDRLCEVVEASLLVSISKPF